MLERGAEHPNGSGPETYRDLVGELRSPVNPMGFYELLRFDTIDVIKGNALGGTSLNNFNAAVVPDREVFLESSPQAVREEVSRGLGWCRRPGRVLRARAADAGCQPLA